MKKIFLLILSLMAGVAVTAAAMTQEQAADVARRFMEARGTRIEARGGARAKAAPHSATNTTVSPVGIDARGQAAVYAVNMGGGGFVLVGGDESADEAQVGSGKASVTGRNFKMSGTMATLNDAKEVYVLDSEGATLTLGTHSVSPFRALFVPLSAGTLPPTLKIAIYNTTPSGITDIVDRRDDVEGPVYNLNGQRVSQPGSGIYIVGGRKVAF
ncbi:MAG: Spi family protease inhibitor [Muribaculaceae bacterium]|nr:Spi family protease inhibitor [Muribaculaceae bacterium]